MSKGGRGRGRGRGNVSFNMEAIGFGRGDQLPAATLQPPPKYPPLRKLPIPLLAGDEMNYLLALKKEYLQTMQNSPYYITAEQEKNDVERYSDKYRATRNMDNTIDWKPDWRRLPKELKIAVRKKKRISQVVTPNLSAAKGKRSDVDVGKVLEALEQKDKETNEKTSDQEEEDDSDAEEVDGMVEDEEDEEDNDYATSYFDNGESYLDEEDDTLDDKEGGTY